MGRYQCHQCYREFSRSDSLRRHKDSGVCKEAQTNMSDSDEESVASARRSYTHGRDIFREYGPDESVEKMKKKRTKLKMKMRMQKRKTRKKTMMKQMMKMMRNMMMIVMRMFRRFNETVEKNS